MAKGIVYVKEHTLMGVYSNKKNLWDQLEKDVDVEKLVIKLNPTKTTNLAYSKVVKYLKARTMLRVYKEEDIVDYEIDQNIENCPSYINLYEVEINTPYKLGEIDE